MQPSFLQLPNNQKIAYHLSAGSLPCVIFCGGFKSDMTGAKATALEASCKARGQMFIRFDYTGHGMSSGDFKDGTIGGWKQDALAVLDRLGASQNILVGSSMGAWISLLVALERPEKIVGFVGVASAPDFTEKLIWEKLTKEQQQKLVEEGVYYAPSCYGEEPYPITKKLIEEARNHLLLDERTYSLSLWERVRVRALSLLRQPSPRPLPEGEGEGRKKIKLDVPVRLLHGTCDEDVPWQISQQLMEKISSPDITLTLIKNGNHRLSEPAQLEMMCTSVQCLV